MKGEGRKAGRLNRPCTIDVRQWPETGAMTALLRKHGEKRAEKQRETAKGGTGRRERGSKRQRKKEGVRERGGEKDRDKKGEEKKNKERGRGR